MTEPIRDGAPQQPKRGNLWTSVPDPDASQFQRVEAIASADLTAAFEPPQQAGERRCAVGEYQMQIRGGVAWQVCGARVVRIKCSKCQIVFDPLCPDDGLECESGHPVEGTDGAIRRSHERDSGGTEEASVEDTDGDN